MNIFLDIDGTICTPTDGSYNEASPLRDRIKAVNRLFEQGHRITYWTARGSTTGLDWRELTEGQLREWGCRYHELRMGKPDYDVFICDKAVNASRLEDYA
jgi:dTDP-glucose 4,6-dehydratase